MKEQESIIVTTDSM